MTQPRRYRLSEIIEGIIIVGISILFLSSYKDVFIDGKTYENYCVCNLKEKDKNYESVIRNGDLIVPNVAKFNASDIYGEDAKAFEDNSFCILYNSTEEKTHIYWRLKGPNYGLRSIFEEIINEFKIQSEMTDNEFRRHVSIRSYIPVPNIPCYFMLKRLNLEQRNMKNGCINLLIKKN